MSVNLDSNPLGAGQTGGYPVRASAQAAQGTATTDTGGTTGSSAAAGDRVQLSSTASARSSAAPGNRLADQYLSSMQDVISIMQEHVQSLQALTGASDAGGAAAATAPAGATSAASDSESLAALGTANLLVEDEAATEAANDGNLPPAFLAAANAAAIQEEASVKSGSASNDSSSQPVSASESQNLAALGTANLLVEDEASTEAANDGNLPPAFLAAANAAAIQEEASGKSGSGSDGSSSQPVSASESQSLASLGTAMLTEQDATAAEAAGDGNVPPAFAVASNAEAENDREDAQEQGEETSSQAVSQQESQNLAQLGTADLIEQDAAQEEAAQDGNLPASFSAISNAEARSEYSGSDAPNPVADRVEAIAVASGIINRNQDALAASGGLAQGMSLELGPDTLGAVDAGNGRTVAVADLQELTGPEGNSDLAAAVLQQAASDLAAAGTQVENYRSAIGGSDAGISRAEELLTSEAAGALTAQTARDFSAYDPSSLIQAAAGGISSTRVVDLLS